MAHRSFPKPYRDSKRALFEYYPVQNHIFFERKSLRSTMIGSDSSTRSGLTQFKDGFEVWDIPQILSDDVFVGNLSMSQHHKLMDALKNNKNVNIWEKFYPDFYHKFCWLFGLLQWAVQRKHWPWDDPPPSLENILNFSRFLEHLFRERLPK